MICPECGAWTEVVSTRKRDYRIVRRRRCANGHKFSTVEMMMVLAGAVSRKKVQRHEATMLANEVRWKRDRRIRELVASGRSLADVAKEFDLSRQRVSAISRGKK